MDSHRKDQAKSCQVAKARERHQSETVGNPSQQNMSPVAGCEVKCDTEVPGEWATAYWSFAATAWLTSAIAHRLPGKEAGLRLHGEVFSWGRTLKSKATH